MSPSSEHSGPFDCRQFVFTGKLKAVIIFLAAFHVLMKLGACNFHHSEQMMLHFMFGNPND